MTNDTGTSAHVPADPDETTGLHSSDLNSGITITNGVVGIGSNLAGRYTLLEVIGEGGMGSVYLAEQTEPVKRQVAVKLIKGGMDLRLVLARFEAERQALALMDHPNIARVYDGGTTPSGQPFFVMELVRGVPITRYCDEHRLTPKSRLELFVPICQAVQHAHQKGIIHRDIKPGNVLVVEVDGRPVPKVIDFGVAKATEQKLTDQSFGDTGAIVGTPVYMSPEQADPSSMDIDTRTDVYALGVMLYELLAGSTPIDASQFRRGALLAMLQMVRDVDPPSLSMKAGSSVGLPNIAANRALEPSQLLKWLRGDIDWIVMKSLEKDRERRYETANGLARDIQRLLADEAVEARPPSAAYRLRKFFRRNRPQVLAAGLLLFVLIGGVIGTSYGLFEAREQRDAANSARAEAVAETAAKELARLGEQEQRRIAESSNRQAFEALKSFTDELMGNLLGRKDQLNETDKAILRNAQKQWETFAHSKGDSPEAREIRAEGATQLASLQYKLGMNVEAESNDRVALALRLDLAKDFPDVPLHRLKVGLCHIHLGNSLRANGNRAEAEINYTRAVAACQSLVGEFPRNASYREQLGRADIALANVKRARSNWVEAEKHYRDALVLQKQLAEEFPRSEAYRLDQTNSHWGLAFTLKRARKLKDSEVEYRLALDMMAKLAIDFPGEPWYRHQSANLARELGVFLYDLGEEQSDEEKIQAGAKPFPGAIEHLNQLAAEFPSLPTYRYDLSKCHRDFGKVLGMLDKSVEAEDQFRKAISRGEKLVSDHPTVLIYQHELGLSYAYFAAMYLDGDNPAKSLEWYGKAIRTLTTAFERDPQVGLTRNALYKCHGERADALDLLKKYVEALPDREKALELCPPDKRDICRFQRVDTKIRSGQVAEAVAELDELGKIESRNPGHYFGFAQLYAIASVMIEGRKVELANRALELLKKAVAIGFKDASRMANSLDLAPIRDREEFKQLLTALKQKYPPKLAPAPPPREKK